MAIVSNRLFLYGTLLPDRASAEVEPYVRRMHKVGKGTVIGKIFDLGDFPGAILNKAGDKINGVVFTLPEDPKLLARLDAYEEYDPQHPEKSLFIREKTRVDMEDGSRLNCWIYTYNVKSGAKPQRKVS